MLADQRGGVQIGMLGEERIKAGPFARADGPDQPFAQDQMFCVSGTAKTGGSQARSQTERKKDVQFKEVTLLRGPAR